MRRTSASAFAPIFLGLVAFPLACSTSQSAVSPQVDAGTSVDSGGGGGDAGDSGGVACAGPCPASKIKYVVTIVMENVTFDTHFGKYCTAPTGSNPTCTDGPACCEAGPAKEPGTTMASPIVLDDTTHAAYAPSNTQACELQMINGGAMDKFVSGASCANAKNFVYTDKALAQPYWDLAAKGAIADRYFQPNAGSSSENDMYLARAGFVLTDNTEPKGAVGADCFITPPNEPPHTDTTIGDLLTTANVPWTFYLGSYQAQLDAHASEVDGGPPGCADIPANNACPAALKTWPCNFDPSDDPFEFYTSTQDNPKVIKDLSAFSQDLTSGKLPAVTFLKALPWQTEHPGYSMKLSPGATFVNAIVQQIAASAYANDTLILVTWDEGGGFFDHVRPPDPNVFDSKPYGTRVPLIAVGPFAKKNAVSHVVMEHSSLVKFIEWNWLGKQTGQLNTRDTNVNNIGSLLDPAKTGEIVPDMQ